MEVLVFVTAVTNFVIAVIELSIAICHSRNNKRDSRSAKRKSQ